MPFRFKFTGGVTKLNDAVTEKFLLYWIIEKDEVSFYDMKKNGLVFPDTTAELDRLPERSKQLLRQKQRSPDPVEQKTIEVASGNNYLARHPVIKVFAHRTGSGAMTKQTRNFYVRLYPENGNEITIRPFSSEALDYIFYAPHAQLLEPKQVYSLVKKDSVSAKMLDIEIKNPLPDVLRREMIIINERSMQELAGVRKLKI